MDKDLFNSYLGHETIVLGNKYCYYLDIDINNVGLRSDIIWPSYKGYATIMAIGPLLRTPLSSRPHQNKG